MGPQVQPKCFRHPQHIRNNWELRKQGYLIRFGHTEALLLKKKKRTLNGHFSRPAETDPYVIKISASGKYPTSNLNLLHLKYVDKAAAELWIEVQIEQMSFVLLLLQNLTMSKIRRFICVFTSKTFICYNHKVKSNLGEDVSGCTLLFALLLCGLCLLGCFL